MCGKTGHFAKVCSSKKLSTRKQCVAAALPGFYLATLAGAPADLSKSVVCLKIQDSTSQALTDTGASESFIHADVAERLRLKPDGDSSEVALASTTSLVKIHGFVNVNASVLGNDYHRKLEVIDKLCADIILGQDFLKLHESVTIEMGSSQPSISICNEQERKATCSVSVTKISPPRLFQFLDCNSCAPIATKSRKFKEEDKKFIKEEISKLLTEGIIEPSESPWRAQVQLAKN